jgi:glycosyltransferase involved in cell wall biosynthesis
MSATAEGYARALESIGARVRRIDPSREIPSAPADGALEINLMCSEVAAHFSIRSQLGEEFFRNRYNIGVWLWESQNFPEKWYDRFAYYDEIWAPTAFIASALAPISPVPVIRMPFVLEPRRKGARSAGRQRLDIRDDEFLYLFVFNFHSRYQRKNPMAVIEAFKSSFRPDEPARLIIKCLNAGFSDAHFQELRRQAAGHRVSIIDGVWNGQAMADLTAACDCYVSLHRAEGVGLTISDAMAEGKPVVATGWSGNMDFMNVFNSFPVCYRLVELEEDVAHYRAGDVWAEPSVTHAAQLMRYVFEHREDAVHRGNTAREDIRSSFSVEPVGARIASRLRVIATLAQFQSLKESVGNETGDPEKVHDAFSDLGAYAPVRQLRYEQLKNSLRDFVRSHVPGGATVVVVSKGDDELLNVDPCEAWHFPSLDREYAGYYPKDSADAIEQLEAVRSRGGDFLLFPSTAFWWLEHYEGFRDHLFTRYTVAHRDESCVMFALR